MVKISILNIYINREPQNQYQENLLTSASILFKTSNDARMRIRTIIQHDINSTLIKEWITPLDGHDKSYSSFGRLNGAQNLTRKFTRIPVIFSSGTLRNIQHNKGQTNTYTINDVL